MSDLLGKRLGQYELLSVLGTGGMAVVYKARQESMDRDVAIKVITGQLAENADFIARFEREARLIAKLQHPHILPVYDFGREGGRLYMVMRLVDGGSLDGKLRYGAMPLPQVARMITGIASALAYAHDQGIVHRDLKPNNILLDTKDNPYLTDFGIAKAVQEGENRLTATGTVMGTPSYMAPEQWRGEPVDARTDIYALGVMLYEMMTGKLPFTGDTPYALMYKHFDQQPPSPHLSNPDLPEGVNEVLNRALAKNKVDRYGSADALAEDLQAVISGQPLQARPAAPMQDEATFIGGVEMPTSTSARTNASPAGDNRTAIGTEFGMAATGKSAGTTNQNAAGRTAAGVTSAAPAAPQTEMSTTSTTKPSGLSPVLVGLGLVILLLIVGGGAFFASQSMSNGNATATQVAIAGQTATKLMDAASTGTALALIPTNTPTATNTATLTPTVALPTAVRFETYTDTTLNVRFRYPSDWEVQKKENYGIFITQKFSDLVFPKDGIVTGAPYIQLAVGDHTIFGSQDMIKAKTAADAMTGFLGNERIQNLDQVFGTRFDTATTTRPRPEEGVVRVVYMMLLGPDRFAAVLAQTTPDKIQDLNNAIALPLVRSVDFAATPTEAVIPTDTATPVVASVFAMPTSFDDFTSRQLKLQLKFPSGWTTFDSTNNLLLSSNSGVMDINNIDSAPYIFFTLIKKGELRDFRAEAGIVELYGNELGVMSQDAKEVDGTPYPTAIGRSLGKSSIKINGWLMLIKLSDENYLEVFAQAPRGAEEEYRDKVLIPIVKSLKPAQ